MDQTEELEFSLEDILREFGGGTDLPEEPAPEPIWVSIPEPEPEPIRVSIPEPEPEPIWVSIPEPEPVRVSIPEPEPEPDLLSGDTVRLDKIQQAVMAESARDLGDTAEFEPIRVPREEMDEPPMELPVELPVEPFSDSWEPDYEEPMGDYPIQEPIVFRPKSRAKELRQKLVSGPEQRYYSLTELGLGRLQLSMILNLIVFAFAAGFTALYAWGMISPERLRLLVFVQFLGMLLSALLGCYRMMEGIADLMKLRFSTNTLLVFTFVVCCVDRVLCLQELRVPVSAAFSLEMTMAIWATYHRRSTEMGQMDTLRRATDLYSVACVPDYHEGKPGFRTGRGEVEHFMNHYAEQPEPERILDWYALSTLAAGLIIGILGGIRHGFSAGVQVCAAALLVGMPATAFISQVRPMAILEKRLHKLGSVLCGWQGVKAVRRQAVYPLEDSDLFPAGAAKLNGVKFYGDREPDEIVAYATALIRANGGALVALFGRMLESRGGYHYTVENLNTYSGGGIGGEIGDDAVLVGTLQFMQDMGVDMGEGTRVSQAVYCAIDGVLSGVFAVTYGKAKSSVAGLHTLCGYRGLTPVVICEDFMLNESSIRSRFGVNARRMAFPARSVRLELAQKEPDETDTVVALTTKEGLAPKAFAVTGARVVQSAMKVGLIIHMVGGILGLLMMAALAWVGASEILSPANVLLYELVWMLPGLLVTEWTRTL